MVISGGMGSQDINGPAAPNDGERTRLLVDGILSGKAGIGCLVFESADISLKAA